MTATEWRRAGVDTQSASRHIEIAETLMRLYIFLTQYIDSCEGDTARMGYPQMELNANFSVYSEPKSWTFTRWSPAVLAKVDKECGAVLP